jgi:hypothetical protein
MSQPPDTPRPERGNLPDNLRAKPEREDSAAPRPKPERGQTFDPAAYAALTAPAADDLPPNPLASFAQFGVDVPVVPPPPPPDPPRPKSDGDAGNVIDPARMAVRADPPPDARIDLQRSPDATTPTTDAPSNRSDTPAFDADSENMDALSDDPPSIYRVTARTRSERRKQTAARLRGGIAEVRPRSYGARSDPTFGYLVGMALSIGLTPILPYNADLRLVVAWSVLAGIGVLTWLVGDTERIADEAPENLIWGVVFGLILAAPLLLVGGGALTTTVERLFRTGIEGEIRALSAGAVLTLVVFVMPLAETLFFRGLMQRGRPFWIVGILGSLWSMALFFPMIEVARFPAIALIIGTALTLMNLIYGYVRARNGLAAAWLCQITINLLLLFVPYIAG